MHKPGFLPMLVPLRGGFKNSPVIAFDTETYGQTNEFQIGVVSTQAGDYLFENSQELLDFICKKEWWNHFVFATNLAFDAFALFGAASKPGQMPPDWSFFDNGSKLIWVKKVVSREDRTNGEIKFRYQTLLDSLNVYPAGVEEMGNVLNKVADGYSRQGNDTLANYYREGKLKKPRWLGKRKWSELSKPEKEMLSTYCAADARNTRKFMEWFQTEVNNLGGELRMTAASTALDLYRRKYLVQDNLCIPQPTWECLIESKLSYYGGRTECLVVGTTDDIWDNDVNSMYPSVMLNTRYPYPSPEKFVKWRSPPFSCLEYEGFSKVTVTVPYMDIPPLPFKTDGKLMFPYGTLQGVWTNLELRYAVSLGCEISEMDWSYFNRKTFNPFHSYVEDLFSKRLDYCCPKYCPDSKTRGVRCFELGLKCKYALATEEVVKLFLNGLYGKFAQNFLSQEQADEIGIAIKKIGGTFKGFEDASDDEISFTNSNYPEYLAKGYVINKAIPKLKSFMNPILSSYTTAAARIKLHQYMLKATEEGAKILYYDTDSLYSTKRLSFAVKGKQLGALQEGKHYKQMLILSPKTKRLLTDNGDVIATAKGIPGKSFITRFEKLSDALNDDEIDELTENLTPRQTLFDSLTYTDVKSRGKVRYSKFLKFKEAMARGRLPNEIVETSKQVSPLDFPKRRILGNPTLEDLVSKQFQTVPWEIDSKTQLICEAT